MGNIKYYPTHEQWLIAREKGVGSSDVAAILGLSHSETPYQLWLRKTKKVQPTSEKAAMMAGHYLEDAVARYFSDKMGSEIVKKSTKDFLFVDDERPYLTASPGRLFRVAGLAKSNKNCGILECKTTSLFIDDEDIPPSWYVQLQWQLGIAHYDVGALAWLTQGCDFGYEIIHFDHSLFDWIKKRVIAFWLDNVVDGKEPELTPDDYLVKYNRHIDGKAVAADDAITSVYEELIQIKKELNDKECRKKELERQIKVFMQDSEKLISGDRVLATYRSNKPSEVFDLEKFQTEHSEMAQHYVKLRDGARILRLK